MRVRPHDCRRAYARRLYEAGAELVAMQQNLGHANLETTRGYIGELDSERRRAPAVYTFDLGRLEEAPDAWSEDSLRPPPAVLKRTEQPPRERETLRSICFRGHTRPDYLTPNSRSDRTGLR